jgi:hypothetical protein
MRRRGLLRRALMPVMTVMAVAACGESAIVVDDVAPEELAVGDSREVELRYLRLHVEGFTDEKTLDDLRGMPQRVLEDVWLLDLPVTNLFVNSLEKVQQLSPEGVAELGPAAQNMHTLLTMTPDNAVLDGTNLEELIALSGSVGIPPAKALAGLLRVEVTDDFIPPQVVSEVMLDQVAGTHPNAQWRRGEIDDAHPDGRYAVAPRSIPISLWDVVTNFEGLADRFGPTGDHPGFVLDAHGVSVVEDEFRMLSKANVNALPYKGVDLSDGSGASVNSIGAQIETLHDFDDPDWVQFEGLVEHPTIERLTVAMYEHDTFIRGGTSREPAGQGDSPAWAIPQWEFEAVLAEMARRVAQTVPPHCDVYTLATGAEAFTSCIEEDGWVVLETFNNLGSPPDPAYLWDLDLEIGQARLHDGGLAEGEGDIALTVHDVEVGVKPDELVAKIRENIEANPEALREVAQLFTDSSRGDADFYYVRDPADGQDYLFFVSELDLRQDADGDPVRGYDYPAPGFFADEDLDRKISTTDEVDGDTDHEKVAIDPGDTVYLADDDGRVFSVTLTDKRSRARVTLVLTRVR